MTEPTPIPTPPPSPSPEPRKVFISFTYRTGEETRFGRTMLTGPADLRTEAEINAIESHLLEHLAKLAATQGSPSAPTDLVILNWKPLEG